MRFLLCVIARFFLFCNLFVLKDMSKIAAIKQKESNSRKGDNSNTIMYLQISNLKSIFTMNTDLQNLSRNANMTFDDIDFCILSYVLLINDHI